MGLVPTLNVLAAILYDSSFAVMVGALLAGQWLRTHPEDPIASAEGVDHLRLLRYLITACLAALFVSHILRPWLAASSMSGSTGFREVLTTVSTVLTSTRQGWLWYANSIALVTLFAMQWLLTPRAARTALWIQIAALCLLAATKAGSSHASEEGDFSLAEISQFIHVLSTAVWSGSIIVSGLLIAPRIARERTSALWNYGHRLSKTVTWALALLLLTGLYVSWRDMHEVLSTLWIGAWGRTLLVKAGFAGLAFALGSCTRFFCLRCPVSTARSVLMIRLLRFEAAIMISILCISGLLANTNPGS